MISYDEAIRLIKSQTIDTNRIETIPLDQCAGRVLAEDIAAKVPSPTFTNSAMDGYAVIHDEAKSGNLKVAGALFADKHDSLAMDSHIAGTCMKIMTGAPVPEWADTVIPVENTSLTDDTVAFAEVNDKGSNIRYAGEDIKAGTVFLSKGTRLNPEKIMAASVVGHGTLPVFAEVAVRIISTGDELVDSGEPLPFGGIYNSSREFLKTSCVLSGLGSISTLHCKDEPDQMRASITEMNQTDNPTVILTTGAVSAGEKDFIPLLAQELGFTKIFHKAAIRPGKPVFLASKGNTWWLGLPGNAVSTCVGWHFFARPLLAALTGMPEPQLETVVLKNEVRKPEHLRCFYRAELNGTKAWIPAAQGSARVMASITADAYVVLPEGKARYSSGEKIRALVL